MVGRTGALLPGLAVALLLTTGVTAGAADWPKWRGPNGDGISLETGLLKDWPQGGPPVVWQIDALGEGYSGAAVSGGGLYTQGNVGGVEKAMAFKEADGSPLWSVQTHAGPGYTHGVGNGPRGTPTVADGRVYLEGAWGDVWCLDAKTGAAVWHVDMVKQFGGQLPGWGYSESPLLYGDLLIVTPGGQAGSVVALNKNTGAPVWRTDQAPSAAEYSSPVAATIGGIPQIVQFVKDGVFGMTADAGRLLWSYRHQKAQNSINITTPIVANDCVLISSAYGNGTGMARIATTGGQQVAEEEVYFIPSFENHHGGIIKVGDYVYGTNNQGLICMEFMTGRIVWQARGAGKGSLTVADGMLYLLGETREMALAEAMADGYREHGRFAIENRGKPTWAHPIVANGRLYIRNQSVLTAYDVKAK